LHVLFGCDASQLSSNCTAAVAEIRLRICATVRRLVIPIRYFATKALNTASDLGKPGTLPKRNYLAFASPPWCKVVIHEEARHGEKH
jgi:hypothetical protein